VLKGIGWLFLLVTALMPLHARGMEMVAWTDDVGRLWLQLTGRIEEGDDATFKSMLTAAIKRGEQITNVAIYSPGGEAAPAMKIGRYIRALHLTTVAPQLVPLLRQHVCNFRTEGGRTNVYYDPSANRGDARCTCAGECFLIWAAGSTRVGEAVQIHRMPLQEHEHTMPSEASTTEFDAGEQKVVDQYLHDMGIGEPTRARLANISKDRMEYLTRDERDVLVGQTPQSKEMIGARCRRHAAGSPAALDCQDRIISELYWTGAKQIVTE
jgi:hypothetical protein